MSEKGVCRIPGYTGSVNQLQMGWGVGGGHLADIRQDQEQSIKHCAFLLALLYIPHQQVSKDLKCKKSIRNEFLDVLDRSLDNLRLRPCGEESVGPNAILLSLN